jgi:hypothetical protein
LWRNQSLEATKSGFWGANGEFWTTMTKMTTPFGYQNGLFLRNEDELPTPIPCSLDCFRCVLIRGTRSCNRRSEIRTVTLSKIRKCGSKMYFLTYIFFYCAGYTNATHAHYRSKYAQ